VTEVIKRIEGIRQVILEIAAEEGSPEVTAGEASQSCINFRRKKS
jgi:hypothetical protein